MFLNFFPTTWLWLLLLVPCASCFVTFIVSALTLASLGQKQSYSCYSFLSYNKHKGMSVTYTAESQHIKSNPPALLISTLYILKRLCIQLKRHFGRAVTTHFIDLWPQPLYEMRINCYRNFINWYGR
jgi:hypothetical protein